MTDADSRVREVLEILEAVGFPLGQGTEFSTELRQKRVARILMGVANLRPDQPFSHICHYGDGNNHEPRSRDIIRFINSHYGESISAGSYDDIRRKNLDFLVEAGIVVGSRPGAATNDGKRGYAISADAVALFKRYGKKGWKGFASTWASKMGRLSEKLSRPRKQKLVPVKLPDGSFLNLSEGKHNDLQKAIVEDFLPRFLQKPELLYLGDTAKKILVHDEKYLAKIGLQAFSHETLPDVVAVDAKRNWVFFIEAVYSANPVSRFRHLKLEELSSSCTLGRVYVSAFLDRATFGKWLGELSWETEVWLASDPAHMIHFNGDRFLGPHEPGGEA
jgi:BsuBI/PstI restriction endonuclease domain/BsuBI/PstI restriction endonuclease HTH domain